MTREKIVVDQAKIQTELLSGRTVYTISKNMGIPCSVVDAIKRGKDRPFYYARPKRDTENLCTCCGLEEKMPGAKYLGFKCFVKHSDESGVDELAVMI